MSEILSVEGQLVGIPVEKYTGVSGIVVDPVNKTIRADETVLFDGNGTAVSACDLSEDMTHFNTLGIYVSNNTIHYVTATTGSHNILAFMGENYPILDMAQFTFTNTGIAASRSLGWQLGWNSTGTGNIRANSSNEMNIIKKVVGINRKAQ